MKKLLLITAILFSFTASIFAQGSEFVFDDAGILSQQDKATLVNMCQAVSENYDCGVYIHTLNDPSVYDIEYYSEQAYKERGLGVGSENTGIMLVLNFAERDYDICAYGSHAHELFTDRKKNQIAKEFLSAFGNNQWYSGFSSFIGSVRTVLENDYASKISKNVDRSTLTGIERYVDVETLLNALMIAFGISVVMALIICLVLKGKMKSVKKAKRADRYVVSEQINISKATDRFSHNTVKVIPIEQNKSKTTISSGGFSHSSGKF